MRCFDLTWERFTQNRRSALRDLRLEYSSEAAVDRCYIRKLR